MKSNNILYSCCTRVAELILILIEIFTNLLNNLKLTNTRRQIKLPESLNGKVAVITGANSGMGKVIATTFAKLGARVVMACLETEEPRKSLDEICFQLPANKKENVTLVYLDLSSFDSVRSCAAKINASVPKIDYLINNAGIFSCPEWKSKDGYEMQFATNHLGHFLLTNLLLDKLKAAPSARIVNVSSIASVRGKINFANINLKSEYNPYEAYAQSKLANALFSLELAKRLKGTNVTSYAVHHGLVDTQIVRYMGKVQLKILSVIKRLILISPKEGAQTALHCAFDEESKQESGYFYINCRRAQWMAPHTIDEDDAAKLWKLSSNLCNLKQVK